MDADETLDSNPADTYLTGILYPQQCPIDDKEDEELAVQDDDSEEGSPDESTPLFVVSRPSAMGLSCTIEGASTLFKVNFSAARYVHSGAGWARSPFDLEVEGQDLQRDGSFDICDFHMANGEPARDSFIRLHVHRRLNANSQSVTLSIVNLATAQARDMAEACLFQAQLSITASQDGRGMIMSHASSPVMLDEEEASNALLYRGAREFAVGHGVAVSWDGDSGERTSSVRTDFMPEYAAASLTPKGCPDLQEFARKERDGIFSASMLADASRRTDVVGRLEAFVRLYKGWMSAEAEKLPGLSKANQETARRHLAACSEVHDGLLRGIRLLRDEGQAYEAFRLANETMENMSRGMQRGSTARRSLVWHPFQLAFVLLTLPSIADPDSPDRTVMDLLWFPTGAGKTEAYLALTAFTIFLNRLRDPERRTSGGTDVLMRYTLRLLTIQQFQRASEMICAADRVRMGDAARLGVQPISIGLFVGSKATPNKIEEARKALDEEQRQGSPSSTPRQLLRCPLCGGELLPKCYNIVDAPTPHMAVMCSNPHCPSQGTPLPIHTIGDEILDNPPSLVIATVDKFAQLPRSINLGRLFGDAMRAPPSLIIQDELHLISGPLGTVVGVYEAAIDLLCTRRGVPPKVIGSTATISHADSQVKGLFDREVRRFPPPAVDWQDSFFAYPDDESGPNRLYMGLSSAGRSQKFALQAVTAALLQAARVVEQKGTASLTSLDPYWTAVLYFNALRELGGAKVMTEDDVPKSLEFYARRLHCKVRSIPEERIVELNSRLAARAVPRVLEQLKTGLDEQDPKKGDPIDVLLATNMISVGMDVARLGLMVVNGQPKSASEYIQATSRIGRGIDGIVVAVYNAGRPRDLSHFEHFRFFHTAMYRSVEATGVTPWSARSRDRSLRPVVVGLVRNLFPDMTGEGGAALFANHSHDMTAVLARLLERAAKADLQLDRSAMETELRDIVDEWRRHSLAHGPDSSTPLNYYGKKSFSGSMSPHLLQSAEEEPEDLDACWRAPNSMREVEPSVKFCVYHPRRNH
jgi:hypothetical protein